MKINNANKAITSLANPERRIPILVAAPAEESEGYIPIWDSNGEPMKVRRLQPSLVKDLSNPGRRRRIEEVYGRISEADWNRLRDSIDLIDRLNAGDGSPVVVSDREEVIDQLLQSLDPSGTQTWLLDNHDPKRGEIEIRPVSKEGVAGSPVIIQYSVHQSALENKTSANRLVGPMGFNIVESSKISVVRKTAAFALSEALTEGLSKIRFVVWWFESKRKLVPGVYCPDIVTALYALAMWANGTRGAWAICRRCNKDYLRSRVDKTYCTTKCQVAAAMQRHRKKKKSSG